MSMPGVSCTHQKPSRVFASSTSTSTGAGTGANYMYACYHWFEVLLLVLMFLHMLAMVLY